MSDLKKQRGLADPRLATDEHRASGDDSAAQNAIEFADTGRRSRRVFRIDLGDRQRLGAVSDIASSPAARRSDRPSGVRRRGLVLLEAVPRAAVGTLAHPFRMNAPAVVAEKLN